jgi:outer membrane protein OmpA-like peptidoglycan-associated protein
MKGTIQLEIEHVKYKDFVDFDNLIDKRMVLAPIKEDQDRAILRFFYEKEKFRKLVHEEAITLVPFKKNTEILLTGTPKGSRTVKCSVQVDDGEVQPFTLRRPINIAALVLGLAVAAALALIGIFAVPAIVRSINTSAQSNTVSAPLTDNSGDSGTTAGTTNTDSAAADTSSAADAAAPVIAKEKKTERLQVYFLGESAVLRGSEKSKLDGLIRKVKDADIVSCEIDGHTADYHSRQSQIEVSENRVIAVQQYLKSALGASLPSSDKNYYGASQTLSTGKTDEYLDRRAEIVIEFEE